MSLQNFYQSIQFRRSVRLEQHECRMGIRVSEMRTGSGGFITKGVGATVPPIFTGWWVCADPDARMN